MVISAPGFHSSKTKGPVPIILLDIIPLCSPAAVTVSSSKIEAPGVDMQARNGPYG